MLGPAWSLGTPSGTHTGDHRTTTGSAIWADPSPPPPLVWHPGPSTHRQADPSLLPPPLQSYPVPTILLADQVTGEEEIPEGVVAVLTPDAPDVLSHVSVRARNMHVLFATCHDKEPMEQIRKLTGR